MKNICDESGLAKSEKGVRWTANAHTQNQANIICARDIILLSEFIDCAYLILINFFFAFIDE